MKTQIIKYFYFNLMNKIKIKINPKKFYSLN